MIKASLLY